MSLEIKADGVTEQKLLVLMEAATSRFTAGAVNGQMVLPSTDPQIGEMQRKLAQQNNQIQQLVQLAEMQAARVSQTEKFMLAPVQQSALALPPAATSEVNPFHVQQQVEQTVNDQVQQEYPDPHPALVMQNEPEVDYPESPKPTRSGVIRTAITENRKRRSAQVVQRPVNEVYTEELVVTNGATNWPVKAFKFPLTVLGNYLIWQFSLNVFKPLSFVTKSSLLLLFLTTYQLKVAPATPLPSISNPLQMITGAFKSSTEDFTGTAEVTTTNGPEGAEGAEGFEIIEPVDPTIKVPVAPPRKDEENPRGALPPTPNPGNSGDKAGTGKPVPDNAK